MDVDPSNELMFTGSNDGELKAWSIDMDSLAVGMTETENGEVCTLEWLFIANVLTHLLTLQLTKMIRPLGSLPLSTQHRVSQISFHPTETLLAVQSHERTVELFHIRTEEEVKKKRARRAQREREKSKKKSKGTEEAESQVAAPDAEERDKPVALTDLFTPYLIVRPSGKTRSFDFVHSSPTTKGGIHVSVILPFQHWRS